MIQGIDLGLSSKVSSKGWMGKEFTTMLLRLYSGSYKALAGPYGIGREYTCRDTTKFMEIKVRLGFEPLLHWLLSKAASAIGEHTLTKCKRFLEKIKPIRILRELSPCTKVITLIQVMRETWRHSSDTPGFCWNGDVSCYCFSTIDFIAYWGCQSDNDLTFSPSKFGS